MFWTSWTRRRGLRSHGRCPEVTRRAHVRRRRSAALNQMGEVMKEDHKKESAATRDAGAAPVSLEEQVQQEFDEAAERGAARREPLLSRLDEPHRTPPLPSGSNIDESYGSVDDLGRAVGLVYQPDEPLETIDRLKARDQDRVLNPAPPDGSVKRSDEIP